MSNTERNSTPATAKRHAQAGFSLAELVVSLFVVVLLLVIILTLFDSTSKLARAQTYVADMQQSARVAQNEMVRYVRMAARGGLTRGTLPDNMVTVEVRNNVRDGTPEQSVGIGLAQSPLAMPDTDILTVRGVFDHLYFLNSDPGGAAVTFDDPDNPTRGTLIVQNPIPSTGMAQSLQPLIKMYNDVPERHDAILIASPLGGTLYHVVEFDKNASDVSNPSRIVLGFKITGPTSYTAGYNSVSASGAFPQELRSVAYIGILEEYRYYIRKIPDPGNPAAPGTSRLSRARFYPGTEIPCEAPTATSLGSLADDIADDITDLQVALAVDKSGDGAIGAETFDNRDEWLFNAATDDPAEVDGTGINAWNGPAKKLFYVRISTVAQTARRDPYYLSKSMDKVEDRAYSEAADPGPTPTDPTVIPARQHRRRLLQTVIDLRNL